MADPGLTAAELDSWAALATLLEWLPAALDAQLERDADVTHFEFGVMYALAHAPDHTLRMSVLAGYANSTLSRLSRAAVRLESRDWLRREPDPADGRYTLATLSAAGRRKVAQAEPGHQELLRRLVFDNLSTRQVAQLGQIAGRVNAAIRPEGAWRPPQG